MAARADLPLTALQRDFGSRDRMVESIIQYILSARAKPTVPDDDPATALIRLADQSGVNGFDATTCFRDGLHRVVAGLISTQ